MDFAMRGGGGGGGGENDARLQEGCVAVLGVD